MVTALEIYQQETAPKITVMRQLLETNSAERNRQPFLAAVMEEYTRLHLRSIDVSGLKNLGHMMLLLAHGKPVFITPNHITDGDHLAFVNVLKKLGCLIAPNLLFVGGVKMLTRPYVAPFTRAVNAVYVATPQDILSYQAARKSCDDLETKDQLKPDFEVMKKMNKTAKKIIEQRSNEARPIVLYVEAGRTRSPNGMLKPETEYYRRVAGTLPKADAFVLPVVLKGMLKILPTNGLYHPQRVDLTCQFGDPYPVEAIWDWISQAKDRNPTEFLFAKIGFLDPSIVEPERYLRFAKIMHESRKLGY